ncbi:hypothetical protein A167_01803 [Alcanivorax sp. S71-1-4]|uniref:RNA 2',3'-cyclic phosphodiesterase n=1 Tax=Alcanivorax sp. S71-1-4 TaxID=1177159 RepID=UPI0013592210|nr:RNA 2',3'-cyclic phosphodiesterase [Alcanivorax sp. S71-1-4]KAF0809520.1 hypothetical protein A167_01803 [Alcanivorax sp. S71-1-4]
MRSFLGLPVTGALRQQLQLYCAAAPAGLARWEAAEDWHLTLVFLGDPGAARQAALASALASLCARLAPIRQPLTGPIPFPVPGSPVLALEGRPVAPLAVLQTALSSLCRERGMVLDDRAFRPHVTLARQHAGPVPPLAPACLEAGEVVLYHSGDADAAGRRYQRRMSWPLGV